MMFFFFVFQIIFAQYSTSSDLQELIIFSRLKCQMYSPRDAYFDEKHK